MAKIVIILLCLCLQPLKGVGEVDQKCPVEPGKLAKPQFYAEHSGQKIYFCCEECVEEFKRSPETYIDTVIDHASPGDSSDNHLYPSAQELFDDFWNAAVNTAGLVISTLLLLITFLFHFAAKRLAPASTYHRRTAFLVSRKAIPIWIALFLGSEAISAHLSHRFTRETIRDSIHEHDIHYTTFIEYGEPPLP